MTAPSLTGDILFESDQGSPPPTPSTDGTVTPSSHGINIWVMHADGSGARPLTTTGFDSQASMSPDGRRVAWVHGDNELWVMASDTSGARRLVQCPLDCQMPRWSADGRLLAYVTVDKGQPGRGHAMVMRPDGTGAHAVVPDLNAYMLSWSPDGRRLAVDVGLDGNNNGLYIADAASGESKRIYGHDGFGVEAPDWAPDGSSVLFSDGNDLYTIRPDGTGLHQLTGTPDLAGEAGQHLSGSWSRDGKRIAFDYAAHSQDSKLQIGVMRADGTGERFLTGQTSNCSDPRF